MTLRLDPDLTPLFNWNTKQLFLYVSAEYETQQGVSPARILDHFDVS